MELISVVVPVYNVEKYLRTCIDSLIKQTYHNLEIILVDDGSQDNSGHICDEYKEMDTRVKVIHKQNAGSGYARNSGLDEAAGEYVVFIDSDDFADSNLVELLMDGIRSNNADTCIGGYKRVSEDGSVIGRKQYNEEFYQGSDVYDKLFVRILGSAPDKQDAISPSAWNVLYSMNIIKRNRLYFPSEREFIFEDYIWNVEYYKYARGVKILDSAAYNYRTTPGSLMQKYNPDRLDAICKFYFEIEKRLDDDHDKITRLQRNFFVNLRDCIKQEQKDISQKSVREIRESIRKMLNNTTVRAIVEAYPIFSVQLRPRVFLLLIKYKQAALLQLFLEMHLF